MVVNLRPHGFAWNMEVRNDETMGSKSRWSACDGCHTLFWLSFRLVRIARTQNTSLIIQSANCVNVLILAIRSALMLVQDLRMDNFAQQLAQRSQEDPMNSISLTVGQTRYR